MTIKHLHARTVLRAAAVAVVAALSVVTMASPASAHDYTWAIDDWWYPYEGDMIIGGNHTAISVCDMVPNNRSVSAEFWYRVPGHFDDLYRTIVDTNGSAQGCGGYTVPAGGRIVSARGYSAYASTGWVTP